MQKPVVVIPNLNGGDDLLHAIESLQAQTLEPYIIVVDNASTDGSLEKVREKFPEIHLISHLENRGYAGGVNPGFMKAMEFGATYVAPFNDDAIADKNWLKTLVDFLDNNQSYGAVCCKVLKDDKKTIDSTGDFVTNWVLPYPRGRDESDNGQYDSSRDIFAASGAASLFRIDALKQVGLVDEDFFAYYEDVDLGFRLQLAGWKVGFEPKSIVYHKIGMTSGRIKGFTTYQTLKNLPLLWWKNMPRRYLFRTGWRLYIALMLFWVRAVSRGQFFAASKGIVMAKLLLIKKISERRHIQKTRKVTDEYIWGLMLHDLPPNAKALRSLRKHWLKLKGKV